MNKYWINNHRKRCSYRSPMYPALHRHSPEDDKQKPLLWHWHSSEQFCPYLPSGHGWPHTVPCAERRQKAHTYSFHHVRSLNTSNLCKHAREPLWSELCDLKFTLYWLLPELSTALVELEKLTACVPRSALAWSVCVCVALAFAFFYIIEPFPPWLERSQMEHNPLINCGIRWCITVFFRFVDALFLLFICHHYWLKDQTHHLCSTCQGISFLWRECLQDPEFCLYFLLRSLEHCSYGCWAQ